MKQNSWRHWTIYVNKYSFGNWSLGIDYYQEFEYLPTRKADIMVARICQLNLLFFNITLTRWTKWI